MLGGWEGGGGGGGVVFGLWCCLVCGLVCGVVWLWCCLVFVVWWLILFLLLLSRPRQFRPFSFGVGRVGGGGVRGIVHVQIRPLANHVVPNFVREPHRGGGLGKWWRGGGQSERSSGAIEGG